MNIGPQCISFRVEIRFYVLYNVRNNVNLILSKSCLFDTLNGNYTHILEALERFTREQVALRDVHNRILNTLPLLVFLR
jgi:hypothetical protein